MLESRRVRALIPLAVGLCATVFAAVDHELFFQGLNAGASDGCVDVLELVAVGSFAH